MADVDVLPEHGAPVLGHHSRLTQALRQLLAKVGPESHFSPPRWDDAGWVGARLAELLPLPVSLKQALLEMDEPAARLDVLAEFFLDASGVRNP